MSIFKNTHWMNATIEKPVNRGNIKFIPGQEVLAHYVPAKYKSGKMVRPEGYEVYSNRIYKSKTHTFALINFLFMDEINVVDPETKETFYASDYSTAGFDCVSDESWSSYFFGSKPTVQEA